MATPLVKEEDETMEEPLLSNSEPTKGGFRTLPFILANEAFERVANYGLKPNMILYLTRDYGLRAAMAANVIFLWSAATDFTPLLWALLADTYVGRYPMIALGSIVCFLGMVVLWFTALIPQARPYCDQFSLICKNPAASQLLFLYSSYGLLALGAGGIRSCSVAFGADQLDNRKTKMKNAGILESYFSWYIVLVNVSVLVALTCVVYVQENFGWKVGFGVPCILMLLSAISFLLASPMYAKSKPNSSVLTGLAQVVVASYKNKDILLSSSDANHEYYYIKGSVTKPSEKLRFLNKACIIRNPRQNISTPDGITVSDPWRLCTVNQVEQLKSVIRIIPIWSTAILLTSIIYGQSSYAVLQAKTMDRHLTSSFEIPAGSFHMFVVISSTLWLGFYNSIALPIASKMKAKSVRLSAKKRMGIGIFIACISMATSAIVEGIRRQKAIQQGFEDDPHAVINMSALWLLPQYIILGISEAFNAAGQVEFYYSELPKTMSSIAITLCLLASSIASLIASLMMSIVDSITKTGNQESWLSDNLNKGHYDYYCWLLFGVGVFSFVYYIACSRAYGPSQGEESKDIGGDEVSDEY